MEISIPKMYFRNIFLIDVLLSIRKEGRLVSIRNCYFEMNIEKLENINSSNEVSYENLYGLEFDCVHQFLDADGIYHIKTAFNHNDIDEDALWEVFDSSDGSSPLELLLNVNY